MTSSRQLWDMLEDADGAELKPSMTLHAKSNCPQCNEVINAADSPEGEKPQPGDVCVCAYCAHLCAYGPALELLTLDEGRLDLLTPEQRRDLYELQTMIRARRLAPSKGWAA